ncbi:TPA: hypothetical protein ACH1PN_002456 [Acinetobacter baumannii]|uniref:hypothetical protein n=1 Tax=Acinetobacter baumannii TaxID=470 RepID=UPI00209BA649|nr:hypothetical protein [Acinetobacter baumannii]
MTLSEHDLEVRDAKRDIGAEILQGIADMKANNATQRTIITETDVDLARRKNRLNPSRVCKNA